VLAELEYFAKAVRGIDIVLDDQHSPTSLSGACTRLRRGRAVRISFG